VLPDLTWEWLPYGALTRDQLYDLISLREEVFVVEQNCPYQDADGRDRHAWHLLGRDGQGRLLAYLRVVEPGHKYAEPSIGRVVTSPRERRTGFGRALMREGIRRTEAFYPGRGIRISAQQRLEGFYRGFGFRTVSEVYDEDGIPHVEMLREAGASGP